MHSLKIIQVIANLLNKLNNSDKMVSVKEILILDQNLRKLVLSKVQLKAVFWEQQEKILQDLVC